MNWLFSALLNFMVAVANIFLAPINTILVNYFPDFSNFVTNFTNVVNNYIGNGVAYFMAILPPMTRSLVLLYISCLIAFYTISLAVHLVIKVIEIIKAVKIW